MLTNRDLQVRLTLKDEMSKRITGVKNKLRSFATSFRKNWLQITAAITAAIMALRKVFEWTEMGAKAKQIEDSFQAMAESMGLDFKKLREEIMKTSAGTVNFSNVADKVSALMAQGLSMEQIIRLMRQARVEARIFGTTTEVAFQNIASAVTGGLVTTLRRAYGLQLSLKEAVESYAAKTGKAKEEVQKYYMAQAIANHILEQGKAHLDAVNLSMMSNYEQILKLKAQWLSFKETVGQVSLKIFVFVKGSLQILKTVLKQIGESFWVITRKINYFLVLFENLTNKILRLKGLPEDQRAHNTYEGIERTRKIAHDLKVKSADDTRQTFSTLFGEIEKRSKAAQQILTEQTKNASNEQLTIVEEFENKWKVYQQSKPEVQLAELNKMYMQYKRYVGDVARVEEWYQSEKKRILEQMGGNFNAMTELAKQSARNIQNAFSTFFFKAFKGELNNLKDVFAAFGDAMLQTIANIMAQLTVLSAVKTFFPSFLGILFPFFHQGGEVQRRHSGGPIFAPIRAHSGMSLASDEVPIIAQTGEGILSRRAMGTIGTEGLNRLNSGKGLGNQVINYNTTNNFHINAVDVDSFNRLLKNNAGAITGIINKAVDTNKSVRHIIKNKV